MPPFAPDFPETPRRPISDTYHNVTVEEAYRWLEAGDTPEVRGWTAAQNRLTRAYLDAIPARAAIRERLHALYTAASADYYAPAHRSGTLFALKLQPPKNQPLLVLLDRSADPATERVLLDPNELDLDGTTTIDFYKPSRDGQRVAVSLSERGSEVGTLRILEVASGLEVGERIPRITYPTGGGDVSWNADGSGFFYTRYPAEGERPPEELAFFQQVYFHRIGTPIDEDPYEIGAEFPAIAEIVFESTRDGETLLAVVANGDGGEFAHFLRAPDGVWSQLTRFEEGFTDAHFGPDGALFLLGLHGSPRGRLLRLPPGATDMTEAEEVVPEGEGVIQGFVPTATRLYVTELAGGPSAIRVWDLGRGEQAPLPAPPITAVGQVVWLEGDEVLFRANSYTTPPAWFRFRPEDEEPEPTPLVVHSPADFEGVEVVREFALASDGTRIPLNILRRVGLPLNGSHPTILYGYGGYGISLQPFFAARRDLWLDQGGVYVIANLRGGGEFGEAWHQAGNLTRKQTVFDDFLACAQHLIAVGYTSPSRLAIEGGSNGGLLMGAALVQRPELFRAVVTSVGIYDMLRVELDPNGAFNITEFGTVTNPEHFPVLHGYSPYHRVVDGTAYPAVLLVTGENDGRVNPAHSRKMTARLQAATTSGHPVLLRTSASAGHGIGTALAERVEQDADVFAFLFDQLAMTWQEGAART